MERIAVGAFSLALLLRKDRIRSFLFQHQAPRIVGTSRPLPISQLLAFSIVFLILSMSFASGVSALKQFPKNQ
jgi:hypothetical protein